MRIGYITSERKGETDALLSRVALRLAEEGRAVCGAVQDPCAAPEGQRCEMDLRLLPEGRTVRISQSLGAGAGGCRIDPGALETAAHLAAASLHPAADLVIVNKFGKQEAEGRGFCSVIAAAIEADMPVITAANGANLDAFRSFCGDFAEPLPAEEEAVLSWCRKHARVRV